MEQGLKHFNPTPLLLPSIQKNIRDLFGLETRDDLDAAGFEFEIWKLKKNVFLFKTKEPITRVV